VDVITRPRHRGVRRVPPVDRELRGRSERRDRPRLEEVERATRERALDVDRGSALGLERLGEPRDLPDLLVVEDRALVHDRALDDGEVGLADGIRVRRHRARRDLLAEPDAGVDDDRPAVAAHRVDGEHDRRRVGRHELLHQHSHARRRGDPVLRSVRDGAFG